MNPCKRMEVWAYGIDREGNTHIAFNGNSKDCTGEVGKCGCIHAEDNLLRYMKNPLTMTISHAPCIECAKLIVQSGVESVMYQTTYRLSAGVEFLKTNNVYVDRKVFDKSLLDYIEMNRRVQLI